MNAKTAKHKRACSPGDRKRAATERTKELHCLFAFSKIVHRPDLPLDELLRRVVNILPPAWQYPEITSARILWGNRAFSTDGFRASRWTLASDILVHGARAGALEIRYREKRPECAEGPFLKEERALLDDLAEQLGQTIERHLDEQALKESEDRYRTLVEDSIQGMLIAQGVPLRLAFVSSPLAAMLGYTVEELQALSPQGIRALVYPDDREELFKSYQPRLAGKQVPPRSEVRLIRKDGGIRWTEKLATKIIFHGQPAVQATFIDITERKQIEQALAANEKKYRTLFDRASDGIVLMPLDGKTLLVNEAFARMHGYRPPEMAHLRLSDLDTPGTHRLAAERLRRLMTGEALVFEVEHYHKDGHRFPLSVSCKVVQFEGQAYYLGFHRDITDVKQADEKQKAICRDLHDGVIQALYALGLKIEADRDELPARDRHKGKILTSYLAELNKVIQELREYVARMSGSPKQDAGSAPGPGGIAALVERFKTKHGPELLLELDPKASRVLGAAQMHHLLAMLQEALSNAVRHAHARQIAISLKFHKKAIRLEVKDDGRGFKPGAGGTKENGISNIRERAKEMQARLAIDSAPGQGTRLRLDFPVKLPATTFFAPGASQVRRRGASWRSRVKLI